jgi:urease accessory protein UreF
MGVYYFDLGPLAAGQYAVLVGVIGQAVDISSADALQTYLAGFVVTS